MGDIRDEVVQENHSVHRAGLVSAFGRVPGTETFVFPTRASPALASLERLLVLDSDGRTLAGEGAPAPSSTPPVR